MTGTAFKTSERRVETAEIDLAVAMRLEALKINQALGSRMVSPTISVGWPHSTFSRAIWTRPKKCIFGSETKPCP